MYAQRTHSQKSQQAHISSERDPSRDHDVTTKNDVIAGSGDSKMAGTSPPSERLLGAATVSTQNYAASASRIIIIILLLA